MRASRSSKARVQVVIVFAVITLLGLLMYVQRHETPIERRVIDQNTIPLKRKAVTEAFVKEEEPLVQPEESPQSLPSSSSTSESDPHNCAYKVKRNE